MTDLGSHLPRRKYQRFTLMNVDTPSIPIHASMQSFA